MTISEYRASVGAGGAAVVELGSLGLKIRGFIKDSIKVYGQMGQLCESLGTFWHAQARWNVFCSKMASAYQTTS